MTNSPAEVPAARFSLARLVPLGRSLLINILGPYLAYRIAAPWFPPNSPGPLMVSAAIPAIDLLVVFARRRAIDAVAVISLVQLMVGVTINLASHSTRLALIGHALQSGALGLVFAGSALIGRPLIVPLSRQTVAGDDPERQARFDAGARRPEMRAMFRHLTLAWAIGLCAESAVRVMAAQHLAPADYLMLSGVLGYAVPAVLIWGSVRYGQARARQSKAGALPLDPAGDRSPQTP